MAKLPKEGRSQEIGRLAGRALGIKLPKPWIETELAGDSDFGLDYLMQLKNKDDEVSFSFYLQLKGTTRPSYSSDKKHISHNFNVTNLKHYHQQEPLVMVAVVDLSESEAKLWECPIYYFWLEDDWFHANQSSLVKQKTVAMKIPTEQLLNPTLDISGFYAKRIEEKFAVAELKRQLGSQSENLVQSISSLTEAITDKPIFLKAIEVSGDEPWIENPSGEIPTLLKQCADGLRSNKITHAIDVLARLGEKLQDFNSHELAEYYFQEASLLALQSNYEDAHKKLKCSIEKSSKDRYKLAYIESMFRLSEIPNDDELTEIAESLSLHDYQNAMLRAKCLVFVGKASEGYELIKQKFPAKVIGQLVILTISGEDDAIDHLIESVDKGAIENDRERYIFHSFAARRAYVKAHGNGLPYGKASPIQGQLNVDAEGMRAAFSNLIEAWKYAKVLGYPSDLAILFDFSPFVFVYFNSLEDLLYHFEQILVERPNHIELIKTYAPLVFNEQQFEKVIELLSRITSHLDTDGFGMLILSNYYLRRYRVALALLEEQEVQIVSDQPQNHDFLFFIGVEMAQELLDEALARKYIGIVEGLESGEALTAVGDFMRKANAEPAKRRLYVNELYDEYIKLRKPPAIAEQLFRYLNSNEMLHATRIVELANDLLSIHELREEDYFHLTQALITTGDFEAALTITDRNVDKERFDPNWSIVRVVCLQRVGKPGIAYNEIKESLDDNRYSSEHLKQYVHLCLQFGLLTQIEEVLVDLLNSSTERTEKLSFLSNLILVYSSSQAFSAKRIKSVRRFGQLVDREDCAEEGQFLLFFLTSQKIDNPKEVEDFQGRLKIYTAQFPDSNVLKQGAIDLDNGADTLIESIHKMTGVSSEQVALWELNKKKIRSGSLPAPFGMLERFLRDTEDIFSSWALANNTEEEILEYKLKQAPQLEQSEFERFLLKDKALLVEDTSLLILSESGVLGKFLDEIDELYLLKSSFDRLSTKSLPLVGSVHRSIPHRILETLNDHKGKLRLISEKSEIPFEVVASELRRSKILLLSDDLNFRNLALLSEEELVSANSFNVVEFLCHRSVISEEEKYALVAKICSFGIHQPNMSIKLLVGSVIFFIGRNVDVDYTQTGFRDIFNKIFSGQRNSSEAVLLFITTLFAASRNSNFQPKASTLVALFRGIIIRHQYASLESFAALLFVYQCSNTRIDRESEFLIASRKHVEYWQDYKAICVEIKGGEVPEQVMITRILSQIFNLTEAARTHAYENVKCCFVPMTETAEIFENRYREFLISQKLFGAKE